MDSMLRKALCKHRRLRDQLENLLLGEDGDEVERQLKNFVAKRPCWTETFEEGVKRRQGSRKPVTKASALEFVTTVRVPGQTTSFILFNSLSVGNNNCGVSVASWGPEFKQRFTNKFELPTAGSKLTIYRLTRSMSDAEIVQELGGQGRAEITFSNLYELLIKQSMGQDGLLLTNGRGNIAHIRDAQGVFCAVIVHWHGEGWYFDSYQIDDRRLWSAGHQVVSRKIVSGVSSADEFTPFERRLLQRAQEAKRDDL